MSARDDRAREQGLHGAPRFLARFRLHGYTVTGTVRLTR